MAYVVYSHQELSVSLWSWPRNHASLHTCIAVPPDYCKRVAQIVGPPCRRIEAWSDTKVSADQLPPDVATWTRERLARVPSANDPAFSAFVRSIAATLLGRGAPGVKINLLAFLETLAVNSDASGLLINSALTPALVQLFGYTSGGAALRARCATVLGILIRYATVIDIETIVPGACALPCRLGACRCKLVG